MTEPERPVLRVVRGTPTAEELAAVVAVLAPSGRAPEPAPPSRSLWRAPLAGPLPPAGPGAWRGSGLPR